MQISLKVEGLDKIHQLWRSMPQQGHLAAVEALNDAAFVGRKTYQDELRKFDNPTPWLLRSIQVRRATPANPMATVGPEHLGGKDVYPGNVLGPHVRGGKRSLKRSEVALLAAGLLPKGYYTVLPKTPYPGSDDGRGNFKGSFVRTLLSYFQAFDPTGQIGYFANMKQKRKDALANKGRTASGYATINGVVFFLSYGDLDNNIGMARSPRTRHLWPGIWARSGIHGVDVRPVMLFVRQPLYGVRFTIDDLVQRANLQTVFASRWRYRLRRQMGI